MTKWTVELEMLMPMTARFVVEAPDITAAIETAHEADAENAGTWQLVDDGCAFGESYASFVVAGDHADGFPQGSDSLPIPFMQSQRPLTLGLPLRDLLAEAASFEDAATPINWFRDWQGRLKIVLGLSDQKTLPNPRDATVDAHNAIRAYLGALAHGTVADYQARLRDLKAVVGGSAQL